jgi:hypothetical protein
MSQVPYLSTMPKCPICGLEKIQAGDGLQCLKCDVKVTPSGLVNTAKDPGDEELSKMLAASGIMVPRPKPKEVQEKGSTVPPIAPPTVVLAASAPFEEYIGQALKIMKSLPMPKNVKQFKAISKIIVSMENLVRENDNANG